MELKELSRRGFVGGVATALGYLTLKPNGSLWAQALRAGQGGRVQRTEDDYDTMAKLANNENPYGPPESVMKAMTKAFKAEVRRVSCTSVENAGTARPARSAAIEIASMSSSRENPDGRRMSKNRDRVIVNERSGAPARTAFA